MANKLSLGLRPNDRLFYNEFEYCLSINLQLSSVLRGMKCYNADEIDRRIKVRKSWDSLYGSKRSVQYTATLIQQLHQVAKLIFSGPKSRIMCYSSCLSIYSNDFSFLNFLSSNDCIRNPKMFKAVVDRPKNSIKLNHSEFSHRTYLKALRPSELEKKQLTNLLKNQAGNIRLSPSLNKYLSSNTTKKYFYSDNFFIDHSGQEILVLLNLVSPGITRKTLDIILNK